MDDLDNENLEEGKEPGDDDASGERLLEFSMDIAVLRIKKIQILETYKIEYIINQIENSFSKSNEFQLTDVCLRLWHKLIDLKDELHKEILQSMELCIALNEFLYLVKYLAKGGARRGLIQ